MCCGPADRLSVFQIYYLSSLLGAALDQPFIYGCERQYLSQCHCSLQWSATFLLLVIGSQAVTVKWLCQSREKKEITCYLVCCAGRLRCVQWAGNLLQIIHQSSVQWLIWTYGGIPTVALVFMTWWYDWGFSLLWERILKKLIDRCFPVEMTTFFFLLHARFISCLLSCNNTISFLHICHSHRAHCLLSGLKTEVNLLCPGSDVDPLHFILGSLHWKVINEAAHV